MGLIEALHRISVAADNYLHFVCNASNADRLRILALTEEDKDMHANRLNALVFALQDLQGLPHIPVCESSIEPTPDSEMPQDPGV